MYTLLSTLYGDLTAARAGLALGMRRTNALGAALGEAEVVVFLPFVLVEDVRFTVLLAVGVACSVTIAAYRGSVEKE